MTPSPGTAVVIHQRTGWYVEYMNVGSWLQGEQRFATEQEAREFCSARRLQVLTVARS